MLEFDINWFAVIAAAVANMILGYVYYHPRVLGTRWMALMGKSMADVASAGMAYAYTAVGALVAAFVLAQFIRWSDSYTALSGAFIGAVGWLGFTATATFADYVFSGRPWGLWSIQNGYQVLGFALMGAIIGVWP
jgi:hypothetical protein